MFVCFTHQKFALSRDPLVSLRLKAYNFYDLSDDRQSAFSSTLSSRQFLGQEDVSFNVNTSLLFSLTDSAKQVNYFAGTQPVAFFTLFYKRHQGGRLYIEVGMRSTQEIVGATSWPFIATFVDFVDVPNAFSASTDSLASFRILVTAVAVSLVIFCMYASHFERFDQLITNSLLVYCC